MRRSVAAWGLQGGATLLECLVGLALGLVVVAAVAVHYLATGQSSRLQAAQAQMTEDAQIGLELLRTDLMMAGFAQPQKLVLDAQGRPRWQTALAGQPPRPSEVFTFASVGESGEVLVVGPWSKVVGPRSKVGARDSREGFARVS